MSARGEQRGEECAGEGLRRFVPAVCCAVTILTLAVFGVGCGGSGTRTSASSGPNRSTDAAAGVGEGGLLRLQLIAAADTICRRLTRETLDEHPKDTSLAEIRRLVPRNARLQNVALAELEKLTAPPSLAREWGEIIRYRRRLADELRKLGAAAERQDSSTVAALAPEKQRVHQLLLSAASRMGFRYCGAT